MGGMLCRQSHYLTELVSPRGVERLDVEILDRYRINKKQREFNRNEISWSDPTKPLRTPWKLPLSLAELIEDS